MHRTTGGSITIADPLPIDFAVGSSITITSPEDPLSASTSVVPIESSSNNTAKTVLGVLLFLVIVVVIICFILLQKRGGAKVHPVILENNQTQATQTTEIIVKKDTWVAEQEEEQEQDKDKGDSFGGAILALQAVASLSADGVEEMLKEMSVDAAEVEGEPGDVDAAAPAARPAPPAMLPRSELPKVRASTLAVAAMISLQNQLEAEVVETSRAFAAYMEDNDIEFDGGSWNVDDRSTNRTILLEIAKIMQDHDHVMLKIHGVQKGETKSKGLMMYREAYPGEPVPESRAITAQGRVLACKAVLVEMGIPSGRMIATAAIGNIREVQFIACIAAAEPAVEGGAVAHVGIA